MIVYHGSVIKVDMPDVEHSYRNLDFGKGFYVTTVKEQAERWAKRKADLTNSSVGVVTRYEMADIPETFTVKTFSADLDSWLDFVCACRDGSTEYQRYDVISGKVANDKVYRVVDMYRRGIWDKNRALSEMRIYDTYDQIAFISQAALDGCLTYLDEYEV